MRNRVAVGCCAIALLGATSACATEGETAGQQTSQASSAAPSASASPVAATFSLAATSRGRRCRDPRALIAAAGSITIAEPDGGRAPIDCASARSSRTVGLDVNFAGHRSGAVQAMANWLHKAAPGR